MLIWNDNFSSNNYQYLPIEENINSNEVEKLNYKVPTSKIAFDEIIIFISEIKNDFMELEEDIRTNYFEKDEIKYFIKSFKEKEEKIESNIYSQFQKLKSSHLFKLLVNQSIKNSETIIEKIIEDYFLYFLTHQNLEVTQENLKLLIQFLKLLTSLRFKGREYDLKYLAILIIWAESYQEYINFLLEIFIEISNID